MNDNSGLFGDLIKQVGLNPQNVVMGVNENKLKMEISEADLKNMLFFKEPKLMNNTEIKIVEGKIIIYFKLY